MCVADDGALNLLFRSNAKAGELSIGWTVVAFTLLGCSLSVAAKKPGTLSKKELKNLAASKNPADQQQLAEYYKDKARGLTTKSEKFAKQAEILATQPATIESKQGISCNCPSHFRYFSKLYAQEAAEAKAEAERRERLAQDIQSKRRRQKINEQANLSCRIGSASGPIAQRRA
jgi:hypothetical protein